MSGWRQARAIALLPGNVTIVIPALILLLIRGPEIGWGLPGLAAVAVAAIGLGLIATGFSIWLWTVLLFNRIGKGTLAAWDPTSRLVVAGPYAYVRNPMITAVATLLTGEAVFFGSVSILVWAALFIAINFAYFVRFEEPGLERRFGEEYREYRCAVPRWLPRRRPWAPV
ncbi:MAG TPA: isoprenylcysteine carboxylmethyltransferase family protein [Solirubrobacterales bacterium]|jgi:protein-S-isoprenylcysteine O-methyltransferase Ste14